MNYQLWADDQISAEKWDRFIAASSLGSVHQTTAWQQFQKQIPGRSQSHRYAAVDDQGEILAGTLVIRFDTGWGGSYWWYSPRGPVFDPWEQTAAAQYLIEKVSAELQQKTRGIFWRLDPYLSSLDSDAIFRGKITFPAVRQYQPTETLMLDLAPSEAEILTAMKRKGRYNIQQAQKQGIAVRFWRGTQAPGYAVKKFYELHQQTTARDGFLGHDESYYQQFLQLPSAYLFSAEKNDEPLAMAINTLMGTRAIYYFGASSSDPQDRSLMAPYALQWEAIRWAKSQGGETYDFLGVAPLGSTDHPYGGITQFKTRFGGYRQSYAPAVEIPLRSGWYQAYRFLKTH